MAAHGFTSKAKDHWRSWLMLVGLVLLALFVRIIVWRWRAENALGGDEREYLDQAVTLLQQHHYVELRLMRPPFYTLFLSASILLVDSLAQHLRLVQAMLSALTVVPMWLLSQAFSDVRLTSNDLRVDAKSPIANVPIAHRPSPITLISCSLLALSYTLAANATELLSETLFLFGLITLFWLMLRAAWAIRVSAGTAWRWAAAAGLCLGALCLVRSVAQPLIPLGALWLAFQMMGVGRRTTLSIRSWWRYLPLRCAMLFVAGSLVVILPWTARNYATYGAFILIDTTGAENLWLDNNPSASRPDDPLGREDAKRQLYALGDDRAARQRLASQRGLEAITTHPGWFANKAWGELTTFFALEYADDMRARPAIWVPLADVWMRLMLGDALWLLLLFAGVVGITLPEQRSNSPIKLANSRFTFHVSQLQDARVLFVPWLLYIVATAMLFHVELRYRLPVYPVLMLYSAFMLASIPSLVLRPTRLVLAGILVIVCGLLTSLHAPYPGLAWQLGWKHYHLWQAERGLAADDVLAAEREARAADMLDDGSALAQVALARAALLRNDRDAAKAALETAIGRMKAHPHAHLLLGDVLRDEGQSVAAQAELAYETASQEDLQRWLWEREITSALARLDIGGGLDLGFVQGFFAAEAGGWRWTTGRAHVRLHAPAGASMLRIRLASGRPAGAPAPQLRVLIDGRTIGTLALAQDWADYTLPLPAEAQDRDLVIELVADTFTPRSYDRASPDGRTLGVMVDWAEAGP